MLKKTSIALALGLGLVSSSSFACCHVQVEGKTLHCRNLHKVEGVKAPSVYWEGHKSFCFRKGKGKRARIETRVQYPEKLDSRSEEVNKMLQMIYEEISMGSWKTKKDNFYKVEDNDRPMELHEYLQGHRDAENQ